MGIEFIDRSGVRPDSDIQESMNAIGRAMVKMEGTPELMVNFPTILESLRELLTLRAVIRKVDPRYGKQ